MTEESPLNPVNPLSQLNLVNGIRSGDRTAIGQSLTLVESSNPKDKALAKKLLDEILPLSGKSLRIGITGIPGAGKSTIINSLTKILIEKGHKVAVLAIDPSSSKSGGSILGDKTRMADIANSDKVFIRPSPTGGELGGTTKSSRESIAVLEAAGYDIVFLETVGVGQSELKAVDMVDIFVVMVIPGAGDELQGIKRGIVELADLILVNKADLVEEVLVRTAVTHYTAALNLLHGKDAPLVLPVSAMEGTGLDNVIAEFEKHKNELEATGRLNEKRVEQKIKWMQALIEQSILSQTLQTPKSQKLIDSLEVKIRKGQLSPAEATEEFLKKQNF